MLYYPPNNPQYRQLRIVIGTNVFRFYDDHIEKLTISTSPATTYESFKTITYESYTSITSTRTTTIRYEEYTTLAEILRQCTTSDITIKSPQPQQLTQPPSPMISIT